MYRAKTSLNIDPSKYVIASSLAPLFSRCFTYHYVQTASWVFCLWFGCSNCLNLIVDLSGFLQGAPVPSPFPCIWRWNLIKSQPRIYLDMNDLVFQVKWSCSFVAFGEFVGDGRCFLGYTYFEFFRVRQGFSGNRAFILGH